MWDFLTDTLEGVDELGPKYIVLHDAGLAGEFFVPKELDLVLGLAKMGIIPHPLSKPDFRSTSMEALVQTVDKNFGMCLPAGSRPLVVVMNGKG